MEDKILVKFDGFCPCCAKEFVVTVFDRGVGYEWQIVPRENVECVQSNNSQSSKTGVETE